MTYLHKRTPVHLDGCDTLSYDAASRLTALGKAALKRRTLPQARDWRGFAASGLFDESRG